jgi:uncharacterized protein YjbI with pentapeptide repeats
VRRSIGVLAAAAAAMAAFSVLAWSSPAHAAPITCPARVPTFNGKHFTKPPASKSAFRCADMRGATLDGLDLAGFDFRGAYLTGSSFVGAYLRDADFEGANLDWSDFSRASLFRATMAGVDATYADFTGAKMAQTDLTDARMLEADLTKAQLTAANLTDANLTAAYLDGAVFDNAITPGAVFDGASWLDGPPPTGLDEIMGQQGLTDPGGSGMVLPPDSITIHSQSIHSSSGSEAGSSGGFDTSIWVPVVRGCLALLGIFLVAARTRASLRRSRTRSADTSSTPPSSVSGPIVLPSSTPPVHPASTDPGWQPIPTTTFDNDDAYSVVQDGRPRGLFRRRKA